MLDPWQRLDIHELAARYGNVIDDRDWDRLDSLFTDDAVFSLGSVDGGVEAHWEGRDAIREMLVHGEHPVAHHVTNVEVLTDGAQVRLLFKVAGPGLSGAVGSAEYDDVLRAQLAIQQLAVRYAMAVDARDLDLLAQQWVPDAWMGRQHGSGPEGVRSFFRPILQRFYRSVHMVVGHRIDLIDEGNATGQVYCRAEHESGGDWIVQAIVYRDTYRRVDGCWGFVTRGHQHWYSAQVDERPAGPTFEEWPGREGPLPDLPHAWPTWQRFWGETTPAQIAAVTWHPGSNDRRMR